MARGAVFAVRALLGEGAVVLAVFVPRPATQEEGVQVVVVPRERLLNGLVEGVQRLIAAQLDAPPDRGMVGERHLEAVERRLAGLGGRLLRLRQARLTPPVGDVDFAPLV